MSSMYRVDTDARVTTSNFPTEAIDSLDVPKRVTADIYETIHTGPEDTTVKGAHRRLLIAAGTITTQRKIDLLFDPAVVDTVSPATGPAAGGTVVTIKGRNLDGVTAVSFGGVAGTALTLRSDKELVVTAPAHAAGLFNVVLTDDSGVVTKTGAYTYA